MSNTKERIISAVVMALITVCCFVFGKITMLLYCLVVGALCVDEVLVNFSGIKRKSFDYKYVLVFFVLFFLIANIIFQAKLTRGFFTAAATFLNLFLVYYLFKVPLKDSFMKKSSQKHPALLGTIIILPFMSFGIYFESDYWRQLLGLLMLVTFSMDTGAWFCGKNFGKHKLWIEVSPKKTVEGFIGGTIIAAAIGSYSWWLFFNDYQWHYSVIFALCGAISQVGDLIQSKIKREFGIKDSSRLIPGHGGIYDRIDSLIFLSPFFAIIVKYLGRHIPI